MRGEIGQEVCALRRIAARGRGQWKGGGEGRGGGWNSCWQNPVGVVDGERARYRQWRLLALGRNGASLLGTVNCNKVSASRDWSDVDDDNDDVTRRMSRSTAVTAYFVDDALLMEEASRTMAETSRDDEGAIGSRDNLVHDPKQQSTNNGVNQMRRRVDVDNTTQQSNNTRERGTEDGGDYDDWYRGATLEGRGRRRKATTIGKEAHNHQLQDDALVD